MNANRNLKAVGTGTLLITALIIGGFTLFSPTRSQDDSKAAGASKAPASASRNVATDDAFDAYAKSLAKDRNRETRAGVVAHGEKINASVKVTTTRDRLMMELIDRNSDYHAKHGVQRPMNLIDSDIEHNRKKVEGLQKVADDRWADMGKDMSGTKFYTIGAYVFAAGGAAKAAFYSKDVSADSESVEFAPLETLGSQNAEHN